MARQKTAKLSQKVGKETKKVITKSGGTQSQAKRVNPAQAKSIITRSKRSLEMVENLNKVQSEGNSPTRKKLKSALNPEKGGGKPIDGCFR